MFGSWYADAIRMQQQVQNRCHDQRGGYGANREHELLLPRRRTDDVTAFEILQVVTTDARGTTNHRADHDRGDRADRRIPTQQQYQDQGRKQDRGYRDSRDRIVR